jgi:hypothetical protein
VIVVRRQHGLDGDDAVAARTVLDHDRLAPAFLQPLLDQPRADVGAGAGAERDDEADRPLRPGLRLRVRREPDQASEQGCGDGRDPVSERAHGMSSG